MQSLTSKIGIDCFLTSISILNKDIYLVWDYTLLAHFSRTWNITDFRMYKKIKEFFGTQNKTSHAIFFPFKIIHQQVSLQQLLYYQFLEHNKGDGDVLSHNHSFW